MHLKVEIYSTAQLPFGQRHERGKEGPLAGGERPETDRQAREEKKEPKGCNPGGERGKEKESSRLIG